MLGLIGLSRPVYCVLWRHCLVASLVVLAGHVFDVVIVGHPENTGCLVCPEVLVHENVLRSRRM